MEDYIEYLQERIKIAEEHNQLTESRVLQECLDTYLSFVDAIELKSMSRKVIVIGGGISLAQAQFKAICDDMCDVSNNAHIQGQFADEFAKQRGVTISQSILEDRSIRITALPRMTEPLIPLDKYGKPLENIKSKFHK